MSNSIQVLLADDDLDDCDLFKTALAELPVNAHLGVVYNGDQLLDELNLEPFQLPDVLFLDLNMPRKNGAECLESIKSNDRLKEIPVIIFSTSVPEALAKKLMSLGAKECIRKPSTFQELKDIILNILQDLS